MSSSPSWTSYFRPKYVGCVRVPAVAELVVVHPDVRRADQVDVVVLGVPVPVRAVQGIPLREAVVRVGEPQVPQDHVVAGDPQRQPVQRGPVAEADDRGVRADVEHHLRGLVGLRPCPRLFQRPRRLDLAPGRRVVGRQVPGQGVPRVGEALAAHRPVVGVDVALDGAADVDDLRRARVRRQRGGELRALGTVRTSPGCGRRSPGGPGGRRGPAVVRAEHHPAGVVAVRGRGCGRERESEQGEAPRESLPAHVADPAKSRPTLARHVTVATKPFGRDCGRISDDRHSSSFGRPPGPRARRAGRGPRRRRGRRRGGSASALHPVRTPAAGGRSRRS